jgi:tetratricopeptide (TPR) repeat protein
MLLAWFATMITLFFADPPSTTTTNRGLPALKHGYWFAVGAILIMALGVFFLPNNKPSLLENPLSSAPASSSLNNSETNSPENPDPDLQARMKLAIQLIMAGKFAEALQEDRESVRLHPNNPLALNNLALNLAANPRRELRNGKEAVQLASQAVELTGQQDPVFIVTLAVAYAEDGQFAKAIGTAKRGRDTALLTCQLNVAALNEQLLKRYSAGKAAGLMNGP